MRSAVGMSVVYGGEDVKPIRSSNRLLEGRGILGSDIWLKLEN